MIPELRAYFDAIVSPTGRDPLPRVHYLAEIYSVNGGQWEVYPQNIGRVRLGEGLYGRLGLIDEEAWDLVCFYGFYLAMKKMDPAASAELDQEMREIWRRRQVALQEAVKAFQAIGEQLGVNGLKPEGIN